MQPIRPVSERAEPTKYNGCTGRAEQQRGSEEFRNSDVGGPEWPVGIDVYHRGAKNCEQTCSRGEDCERLNQVCGVDETLHRVELWEEPGDHWPKRSS